MLKKKLASVVKLVNTLDFVLVRVIFEKSSNENQGNCWDNLRVPLTTTWLETTCVTVQKLSEIGQSAAEPLKQFNCDEEGSETSAPDT